MTTTTTFPQTTFKLSFIGREKGAIGKRYQITKKVTAFNQNEAELKLYDNYEHIAILGCIALKTYDTYSDTIRQMPQNYIIAHRNTPAKSWICEPDLAANKDLCVRVFTELMNWDSKYANDPLQLLAKITPNSDF